MELIQPIAAAILVLALLAGALFLLRSRGIATFAGGLLGPPSARRMELVDRLVLNSQHQLHLVRVDDQTLFLVTGPQSCQVLSAGKPK